MADVSDVLDMVEPNNSGGTSATASDSGGTFVPTSDSGGPPPPPQMNAQFAAAVAQVNAQIAVIQAIQAQQAQQLQQFIQAQQAQQGHQQLPAAALVDHLLPPTDTGGKKRVTRRKRKTIRRK